MRHHLIFDTPSKETATTCQLEGYFILHFSLRWNHNWKLPVEITRRSVPVKDLYIHCVVNLKKGLIRIIKMCTVSDTKVTKQANPPPANSHSLKYLCTKFTFICRLCCNSFVIFILVCHKVT